MLKIIIALLEEFSKNHFKSDKYNRYIFYHTLSEKQSYLMTKRKHKELLNKTKTQIEN